MQEAMCFVKKILIPTALLFCLCSAALAENSNTITSLGWKDCVALALRSNPDLASSRQTREASRSSYHGSFNGLLPQVTLSNSYNDSGGNSGGSSKGGSGPATWQAQGSVNLNLINAAQIANVRTSAAQLTQSEANLRQASSLLRFNLRKAYAQLLFAQKSVEVSRSIKERRQKNAQLVTLRYDSGRESKGNMLRAKAQLLQANADLAQALREVRTAQKSLDRQLGLDDFSAMTVTGTFDAQEVPDLPSNEASLLIGRPDILVQEAAVKIAEANLNQSKSSLWPNLSLNYSRFGTDTSEFPSSFGWSFAGILSYPLFGSGPTATYFAVAAAKKNLERSKLDLRSVREQAVVDIETSWSGFAGAIDQSGVQSALLDAARQRNDEADVRYASGLMSYDNWEIIASDRVSQERQAIQAQLNAMNAQAAWEKSLGKMLEE